MRATRPGPLLGLVLLLAVPTWLLLKLLYVSLPPLPWTAVPTLLLLALGEAFTGYNLRARILRKPDTRPVEPMVAARMAALAKASAYSAAVLAGIFAGFAVHVASMMAKATPRQDFYVSAGSFVSALVLVGAALFLEYCCRVPKGPDDEDDRGDGREPA